MRIPSRLLLNRSALDSLTPLNHLLVRSAHPRSAPLLSLSHPFLFPLTHSLTHSLTPSHRDDDLWVGIIASSHPKVFCAGADLKAVSKGGQRLDTDRGGFAGLVSRPLIKPLIAAVDGFALAGG